MKKKVLVVDDDLDILDSISIVLETEGYDVATTPRANEAFSTTKTFVPDLIILDLLLSGEDGSVICSGLKAKKETNNIPVIMMSAHPSAADVVKKAGADDFLSKPFNIDDLIKKVSQRIKLHN